MIDRILIKQRLSMIATYCRELELLKELPKEKFLEKRNSAAAESFLRRSLEAVFDIGRHILAKIGHLDLAKEYKSIALGLSEKKVVSGDLSKTLVEMAGYRNRLVHLYHMVSDEELFGIVQNYIADLQEFCRQISRYIKEAENTNK
jgi:uncharacterized protein YutE (UPF0331/DUF86 family)